MVTFPQITLEMLKYIQFFTELHVGKLSQPSLYVLGVLCVRTSGKIFSLYHVETSDSQSDSSACQPTLVPPVSAHLSV